MKKYFELVKRDEEVLENFESYVDKIEHQFFNELKDRFIEPAIPTPSISSATVNPYPQFFDIDDDEETE